MQMSSRFLQQICGQMGELCMSCLHVKCSHRREQGGLFTSVKVQSYTKGQMTEKTFVFLTEYGYEFSIYHVWHVEGT